MIGPTDLHPSPAPHFKTFQVFLIYCPKRTCYIPDLFLHAHNIRWEERITKLLTIKYAPVYHLVPPTPKRLPHHPILEHPQAMFFHWCEIPSLTHIHNKQAKLQFRISILCIHNSTRLPFWPTVACSNPVARCSATGDIRRDEVPSN
jgi:hypothetical protein